MNNAAKTIATAMIVAILCSGANPAPKVTRIEMIEAKDLSVAAR